MTLSRRHFLGTIAATAAGLNLKAQLPESSRWGGRVRDIHFHLRQNGESNVVHMKGCGISNAVLLARESSYEQIRDLQSRYPGKFAWAASADITKPEAEALLTKAIRNGAAG